MRQDDIALERGEIVTIDACRGQFSEAGVDAVDRNALPQDARNRCRTGGDAVFIAGSNSRLRHDTRTAIAPMTHCQDG